MTGIPFGVTRGAPTRGISMDRPPPCQVSRADPQRAVAPGSEPERRFERAGEVRLIGESRLARDFDQRTLLMNPIAREGESAHEKVAVRARAEHDPELTGEVVSRQARDRLQLPRVHDTRSFRVEELASALDGG